MATWKPSFLFIIDSITLDYQSGYPDVDPENGFWRPPRETQAFNCTSSSGLQRWDGGTVTDFPVNDAHTLTRYSVASVFYQSESGRFLAVPTDCRDQIVDRTGKAWRQVGFEYREDNNISILGCEMSNNYHILAAPGSSTWMPEMLPAIYNRTPMFGPPEHSDPGGLAGSLSLLVALTAFAWEPANMAAGINYSFQSPNWRRHGRPIDRGSKLVRKP
ncbi:hypothetical protein MMC08_003802 [Hypocenomyce scalaris]|nr:hypothetical protein [Hypocenomyce scalaris]